MEPESFPVRRLLHRLLLPSTLLLASCGGGGGGVSPGPPPANPVVLSVGGLPPSGLLAANTTYTLTATETLNGAPVPLGPVTFGLDNPAVGTISGSTLTTGIVNAAGHVTATDPTRNAKATATVKVGTTRPATNGDTANFAGTLTTTYVRPLPNPMATEPPTTLTSTVAIAGTVATSATFNAQANVIDFKTVENDVQTSPNVTLTTTTDTFEKFKPGTAPAIDLFMLGSNASDSNGVTYATVLGTGNGLIDVLPETSGATFTNTAAETYLETEPDTTTLARTVNADGSYTETDTFAGPEPPATITVNPDFSGSYTNAPIPGGGIVNLTFGAPQGSGASAIIPITYMFAGQPPQMVSPPVHDWYPSTTLYADNYAIALGQAIPSGCNVPAGLGTSATTISENLSRIDPVLGTYEQRTAVTYLVPSYGEACVALNDQLADYYDYSGQSQFLFAATPQQITTTAETVGFSSGTIAGASTARRPEAARTAAAPAPSQTHLALALGRATFNRAIERLYTQRRKELHAFFRHHTSLQRVIR